MCLGVPGKVVAVDGLVARVDFWGIERSIDLHIVDEPVAAGDYVLNHVGYAIRRIPQSEVAATLALYEELIAAAGDDLMAGDVRAELAAGRSEGDGDE